MADTAPMTKPAASSVIFKTTPLQHMAGHSNSIWCSLMLILWCCMPGADYAGDTYLCAASTFVGTHPLGDRSAQIKPCSSSFVPSPVRRGPVTQFEFGTAVSHGWRSVE